MKQTHDQHYYPQTKQKSLLLKAIVIPLILLGASIWMLSISGMIKGPWSNVLEVAFTVFSVVLTFLQWHIQSSIETQPAPINSPTQQADQDNLLIGNLTIGVNKQKGLLIVYTKKNLRGKTVLLNQGFDRAKAEIFAASNVVERRRGSRILFTSIFPSLEPGNYTVSIRPRRLEAQVTVFPRQITEIDWR